jgi:penicillin V acylase-like amidase (Ntn superfamily)
MTIAKTSLLGLALFLFISLPFDASACTSFKLETDQGLFFAHSLNQGSVPSIPGLVFINQRNVWKKGYSWATLTTVSDESGPSLVWRSVYGSVTFNPFGPEHPDGGMNEAGLYIWEMGFDTEYPADTNKPTLFQAQWMQYVLDNFGTVDEVMQSAHDVCLDGWGWHYFVADTTGKTAIIDFVDRKVIVYSGDDMPIPLCCNSSYPTAMKWLNQYDGFGGELAITKVHEEIPRFIYGAKLMQEFDTQDPVAYSFYMLDEMSENVRWSVVFDVAKGMVYFKTNLNQNIRSFAVTPADFGRADGPLILDIECPGPGDVRNQFVPYKSDMERGLLTGIYGMLCDFDSYFRKTLLDDQGATLDQLVESIMRKMAPLEPIPNGGIIGEWSGSVTYPTGDSLRELPMTLVLRSDDGRLSGTIDDAELIKNLRMTNIAAQGGLLHFTIKRPDSDDLLLFQLHATVNELNGAIDICGREKNASVRLSRVSITGR